MTRYAMGAATDAVFVPSRAVTHKQVTQLVHCNLLLETCVSAVGCIDWLPTWNLISPAQAWWAALRQGSA